MLREFNTDKWFLTRYYLVSTALLLAAVGLLWRFKANDFAPSGWAWLLCLVPLIISNFVGVVISNALAVALTLIYHGGQLEAWHLLLAPAGIYLGMLNVPVIHNCAHRSFKPLWLNRVLGELCALHLMSGYPGFVILHLTHHRHADDPELDPHPNLDLSFWQYLNGLKLSLRKTFHRLYFGRFGDTPENRKIWKGVRILLPVSRVLRSLLILMALGPIGFSLFYIPSFIANQLTYAHINYYTHARRPDGSVEIINMNHNALYRFLNRILIGIYFHREHHARPGVFNPSTVANPVEGLGSGIARGLVKVS